MRASLCLKSGTPRCSVLRAEVRLLSLQGLQHPVGERLRVVCAGHQQGKRHSTAVLFVPRRRASASRGCGFSSQVYFKQFCRVCQKSYNPYRVEDITCQVNQNVCISEEGFGILL